MTIRIAMWSGPRNISTAMMRAWENRADCTVVDEPLYAAYLAETGLDHPLREEILASQPTDWRAVVPTLTKGACGSPLSYQKHMTQHLLPTMDRGWIGSLRNAFLVRDPRRVVASYAAKRGRPTLDDLGLLQQAALYDELVAGGACPAVLAAEDVLREPRRALVALCEALDIAFDEAMLAWPKGPRDSDGVWARHWYGSVRDSTEFSAPGQAPSPLDPDLEALIEACEAPFRRLWNARLELPPRN